MENFEYIRKNIEEIKKAAEKASEGSPNGGNYEILLATKYATPEEINFAHSIGINKIGENRVQSLIEKYEQLDRNGLDIHFIGTLQKNKVKYIIDKVCMIESLDSIPLAEEIEKQAAKHGIVMDCLAEINIGNEAAKGGVAPCKAEEFIRQVSDFPHINLCGIMTMAPKCNSIDEYRKYFKESYDIFIDIFEKKLHNINRCILSMGMSESFEAALCEGASLVRIGRAAFKK